MARLVIDISALSSPEFIRAMKERMSKVLRVQTLRRLRDGGDDEITLKPLAHPRADGSTDRPLLGPHQTFARNLASGWDANSVWVQTQGPGAAVHQEGTIGASSPGIGQGKRPTIRPVYAKALYIPLTTRAAAIDPADRNRGVQAARERVDELKGRSRKDKRNKEAMQKARQRLRDALEARAAVGLVQGVDFILRKKVDIPPRPFLRLSRGNVAELAEAMAGGSRPGE